MLTRGRKKKRVEQAGKKREGMGTFFHKPSLRLNIATGERLSKTSRGRRSRRKEGGKKVRAGRALWGGKVFDPKKTAVS